MKHSFREIKRKIYWKSFATSLDYEHYANRRHEWVRRQLQDIPPGLKILDAGAGQMRYKKFCKHLDYSSSDFGKYDGRGNGKAGQSGAWDTSTCDVICDITDMPFPDETFDAVMCTEVLEHVKNPELAIKELIRVLKKNGKIILTAPFGSYTHEAPYHYCTGFNTYWYEYVLPKYGCKIVKMDLHSNFFEMLSMDITACESWGGVCFGKEGMTCDV